MKIFIRKNKKTLLVLIVVFFFAAIKESGALYPSKYCVDGICVKRPNNYIFHYFITKNYNLTGNCIYSLSCKNNFLTNMEKRAQLSFVNFKKNEVVLTYIKKPKRLFHSLYKTEGRRGNCLIASMNNKDSNMNQIVYHEIKGTQIMIQADDISVFSKVLNEVCSN